ncbi:hypothetical protein [Lacipirellula sp.]|uniref:hypothetical protein n=1 Tax=Lacipirellula sp. TaxID=2691419 RepID=UPI003D12B1B7
MVSLAGIIGNNSIGYKHKFSKVNKAIYRSSFSLLQKAMLNQKWEVIELAPNKFIDVIWGTPDHSRLENCFDRIARGLHYHHFAERFQGVTKTVLGFLKVESANAKEFQRFLRDKVSLELQGTERLGENPDVFSFQFTSPDQFGLYLLHLRFYGGLDVYVGLIPDGSEAPKNLAMHLIDMGITTTISIGDEKYCFNNNRE